MNELQAVVGAAQEAVRDGRPAVLATVVSTHGSTYRRPGARMLLTEAGWQAGSISGGCLESDVLKKAWWRTQNGPALVTYDSTADDDVTWGFGLGCNGVVQVLLERLTRQQASHIDFLHECLSGREAGVLATVFKETPDDDTAHATLVGQRVLLHSDGTIQSTLVNSSFRDQVQSDARQVLQQAHSETKRYMLSDEATVNVLFEVVTSPTPLVIVGAGHDVGPLVQIAKEVGWHVTVVDTRAGRPRPERFPLADVVLACPPSQVQERVPLSARTAALLMTHSFADDQEVLPFLLDSPAFYVGALGPRSRTERLLRHIQEAGVTLPNSSLHKLHAPVGLDIGADGPAEIALSVVAEVQAVLRGRSSGSLRDRPAPVHPRNQEVPQGGSNSIPKEALCARTTPL